jgi:hypothetical protein
MAATKPSEKIWLAEYEAFRSELLVMMKERYSILAITVTAIGVAFGFAAGANSKWVVFLIPLISFVVILPFAYLTSSISENYHRTTAYLEVFIEPNLGLQRERAWNIYYKEFPYAGYSRPLMTIYALLIFASGVFPLAYIFANAVNGIGQIFMGNEITIAAIEALVGSVVAFFVWYRGGNVSKEPNAIVRWKKVRELIPTEKDASRG